MINPLYNVLQLMKKDYDMIIIFLELQGILTPVVTAPMTTPKYHHQLRQS